MLFLMSITSVSADDTFFETRIRPVLVDRCLECHGPDKPKSGLGLHSRNAALKGGEMGLAIVPGKIEESLLINAIEHRDDLKMPPRGPKLDASTINDFKTWIQTGAAYPDSPISATGGSLPDRVKSHWAFQPLRAVSKYFSPGVNPVDYWIDRALFKNKMKPAPMADRRTLLRRASHDLTGLPPEPAEMQSFLTDKRPTEMAFAKQVDRLLSSPRFGERWARHWLDLARYSDAKGYVFFEEKDFPWSFTYRDYCIKTFNSDKAYNQFILEQIAADRLGNTISSENLAALGFITLGGRYMNNPHDIIDDRIDVVTRPLMGLTVACARCHDHKYDPISSQDYYALYSIFANSIEPPLPPPLEQVSQTKAKTDAENKIREDYLKLKAFVDGKYDQLIETARRRSGDYLFAAETARKAPKTEDFMLIADGGDLNPTMIVRWQAFIERSRKEKNPAMSAWNRMADTPAEKFPAVIQNTIANETNLLLKSKLQAKPPANLQELANIYTSALLQAYGVWREYSQRALSSGMPAPKAHPDRSIDSLRQVLDGPSSPTRVARNPQGDLTLLPDRASQAQLQALIGALEKSRRAKDAAIRPQMLADREMMESHRVFIRGNPQNPGIEAPRRFLQLFETIQPDAAYPADSSGRLELARSITSPANPLTARVYVNRVWGYLFGVGLVSTPGDFGARGNTPDHPELLDHLARDFMNHDWSTKRLIRKIMTSRAYMRSSYDFNSNAIDPENKLLSHQNSKRLDFESMRDSILAVSGLLDTKMGGPATGETIDFKFRRRGIYGRIDRLNLPEQLRTFDFPDPNTAAVERSTTTTPAQSLFLLNHPLVQAAAEGLVNRAIGNTNKPDQLQNVISEMAKLTWQRELDGQELDEIKRFVGFESNSGNPDSMRKKLISIAQMLLISNEFHFID